jgi:N-sulfoglucosamine sulfohydrolase
MRHNLRTALLLIACFLALSNTIGCSPAENPESAQAPNILLIITDDQSWEHVGAYGDLAVRTPNIDRLAKEGVRFDNAYAASPSCTPSRGAVITGQQVYRLQEGGVLWGFIREQYPAFPLLLRDAGYAIGYTGKGYGPTPPVEELPGAHAYPLGASYNDHRIDVPAGLLGNDYAGNFDAFLGEVAADQPFFFWFGIKEPHIPHPTGLGAEEIDISQIRVPEYLPDTPEVRSSIADYLFEVEWADSMIGKALHSLQQRGDLENTVVIFTSDNGMPFPRAKATLYDAGVRMPLLIRWGDHLRMESPIEVPVSLTDIAPTLLELAGLDVPAEMTGQSLNPLLLPDEYTAEDQQRDFAISAIEKHVGWTRHNNLGYPRRAIHTQEWTYIRNYEPDRWPAGDPDIKVPNWDFFGDSDPTPAKQYMLDNRDDAAVRTFFELSFGKVPEHELYNKVTDPDMIHNLAYDPAYAERAAQMRETMEQYLIETDDPRSRGETPWDSIDLDR